MQGRLIVFEGTEGSGKSTQVQRLHQWIGESGALSKLASASSLIGGAPPAVPQVVVTREPGGTSLGMNLRQLLLGNSPTEEGIEDRAELLLYAADRAQHVEALLKPYLAQGALVLCDRYTDSTIAYQGYGRGLSLELVSQLNQIATGGLESDLTFWLDLDVKVGLDRVWQRAKNQPNLLDRMEQDDLAFHQRVQQGFSTLAQQYPHRIVRVDATQSEAAVAQQIQAVLRQRFQTWY
ncbi:MAG TPA: dTMP kinase [Candidatus Caenarcaniphilales bacterium]